MSARAAEIEATQTMCLWFISRWTVSGLIQKRLIEMFDSGVVGADWLCDEIEDLTEEIEHMTPVEFNEEYRYLPTSVSDRPGPFSFKLTPYWREIVNQADPRIPTQQVNVLKGVQVGYTTALECILLYFIAFIKTRPCMLISADRELVTGRIENCILPMLEQSGLNHLIQSSDEGNSRKTGKTANHLQWDGGGFLIPGGANNADKMRMWSILLMLKDEIDAWKETVGKDGDPDKLTDARCDTFKDSKKIYRGGTPLIKATSKIWVRYNEGDKRVYKVPCKHCGQKQDLRWSRTNKETGEITGFVWDYDKDNLLIPETVRYLCEKCGGAHYEHDKTWMFATENGAEWVATATPKFRNIRSYMLPAFYSPAGFRSWSQCAEDYLDAYDPIERKITSIAKYQVFYNNVLAMPFEFFGDRVQFSAVSGHRRSAYKYGEIPNDHALEYAGSRILFLTCTVDVHKNNLAVAVMGWTELARCYVIDYWRFETDGDTAEISSQVWVRLRELIEEFIYTATDGAKYKINTTLIDAGYNNSTVVQFCSPYSGGVYPILGRSRASKNATIKEFSPFETQAKTVGYKIVVDHYKDIMSTILKREWHEDTGLQKQHHFNVPVDASDKQIKELTVEYRKKETDPQGAIHYKWHRPSGADNELFDLLGYGFAAVDIVIWAVCIEHFELEAVDEADFWRFASSPDSNDYFARLEF